MVVGLLGGGGRGVRRWRGVGVLLCERRMHFYDAIWAVVSLGSYGHLQRWLLGYTIVMATHWDMDM